MTKWVYGFGGGSADGDASMKNLLGGKGANLAEMSSLGLPVPPGFTITTEVCTWYYANQETYPSDLTDQVKAALAHVEGVVGKTFGDAANPLLVSVRSGARASMPGMMDTVLNLGLNDETVEGLAKLSGDRRFAFDSYRRFITMYSNVVLGLGHDYFEEVLDDHKDRLGVSVDTELTAENWEKVVADYKALVERELGKPFPQDPQAQLWGAVGAVFESWMNDRAKFYRRMHDIPESWGTAVNVQSMVFGNMGETSSATGVAFTRNPSTGENKLYGEFLINAQGEDVVAGIRTPQSLTKAGREEMGETALSMEEAMPAGVRPVRGRGGAAGKPLPRHAGHRVHGRAGPPVDAADPQRQAHGQVGAEDRRRSGLRGRHLSGRGRQPRRAGRRWTSCCTRRWTRRRRARSSRRACPPRRARRPARSSSTPTRPSVWARRATPSSWSATRPAPEDIHGMHAARGIVTARGGMTSHAAVVARGMGRPCVSGAGEISPSMRRPEPSPRAAAPSRRARSSPSTAARARCWTAPWP
jgi:pyruvate,orthophosphate dikinase